jgi:hypothetical protein
MGWIRFWNRGKNQETKGGSVSQEKLSDVSEAIREYGADASLSEALSSGLHEVARYFRRSQGSVLSNSDQPDLICVQCGKPRSQCGCEAAYQKRLAEYYALGFFVVRYIENDGRVIETRVQAKDEQRAGKMIEAMGGVTIMSVEKQ